MRRARAPPSRDAACGRSRPPRAASDGTRPAAARGATVTGQGRASSAAAAPRLPPKAQTARPASAVPKPAAAKAPSKPAATKPPPLDAAAPPNLARNRCALPFAENEYTRSWVATVLACAQAASKQAAAARRPRLPDHRQGQERRRRARPARRGARAGSSCGSWCSRASASRCA